MRAAINLGNPILAKNSTTPAKPTGVSVDLAGELASRLRIDLKLIVFDAALKSVEAVIAEQANIGFFAIDPDRSATIAFTAPYLLIEGYYLVRDESSIQCNEDVDRASNRVAVGRGSAYDLFLTRQFQHAHIVRAPTSPTVVQTFLDEELEVAAGVKQQLETDAMRVKGLRLLAQRFMVIQQAIGTPKSRGPHVIHFLQQFVDEMIRSGYVADSLARNGVVGASVAPLR